MESGILQHEVRKMDGDEEKQLEDQQELSTRWKEKWDSSQVKKVLGGGGGGGGKIINCAKFCW